MKTNPMLRCVRFFAVAFAVIFAAQSHAAPIVVPGGTTSAPSTQVSANSLIDDRPERVSYSRLASLLAYPVMQFQGTSSADGRPISWHNYDRQAIPGAWRGRPFTVPAGVTGVRLRLAQLAQHVSVGATGAVRLQVYDALGLTQVSSTSCVVPASAADCTSATITVTPGLEYQARIVVNNSGTQSSFTATRFAVEVATTSDSFWSSFSRLDTEGHLWGVNTLPGAWSNPRRPDALAFAELKLRTTSPQLRVETWENVGDYVGAGRYAIRVNVAGVGDQILTPAALRAVNVNTATVSGPFPAAVTVTSGLQATSAYPAPAAEPRGVYLSAVYVPRGAYIEAIDPPRQVLALVGDSKTIAYAAVPAQGSLPAYLRGAGYDLDWSGIGGRTLLQDVAAATIPAAWPLAQQLCAHHPSVVVIQSERNDLSGGTLSATIVSTLGSAADATHNACPLAKLMIPQITRENASWDVAGWDTHRAAVPALVSGTSAIDSTARSNWLTVPGWDGLWTKAEAAATGNANSRTADGTHPADAGFEREARVLIGAEQYPPPTVLSSAALWVESDYGFSGGGMGTVTSGGTSPPNVTITGTPATAVRLAAEVRTVVSTTGTFRWSADAGKSWPGTGTFSTTGQTVLLDAGLGLSLVFPSGSYNNLHTWRWDAKPITWSDLSGNGRDLFTISSIQTLWSPANSSYRGQPTITIAGGSFIGRAGLSIAPPFALVYVGAIDAQSATKTFVGRQAGGTGLLFYVTSGTAISINDGTSQLNSTSFSTATSPHCYVIDYEASGTNSTIYIDGIASGTGNMGGSATLTSFWIGFDATSGNSGLPTSAAFALIPGQITTDQINGICRRSASKWGTP